MKELTSEQRKVVNEILKKESTQNKVDKIVNATKAAMGISTESSIKEKVDTIIKQM